MLFQKRNSFCIVLPRASDTVAAPLFCVLLAEFDDARFRPGQRLRLDPGPFNLRQYLAVEGRIFAENRVGDQLALMIMPESNVFPQVQVASHHKESPHQFADVRIAPIIGARTRLHQQAQHLLQVMFGFVEAGCQRACGRGVREIRIHWLFPTFVSSHGYARRANGACQLTMRRDLDSPANGTLHDRSINPFRRLSSFLRRAQPRDGKGGGAGLARRAS